jgi:phospholipid/cholesterol/gamma-HCH transport system ATP-binding protein
MGQVKDPIIRVGNLTAGYGGAAIVRDISFEVGRGEVFAIIGGSGSGKSTLMKHMIGLFEPISGNVLIDGEDIFSAQGDQRFGILKKIGVMYQRGALFGSMTLLENVRLPLEEFTDLPPRAMDLIAMMKLKLVGLHGAEDQKPSELSGGMQKRAAIARAMAMDPQILFLDEPSSGLDPLTSVEVDHLIVSLARSLGITFVVVSHELPSIFAIADRVIILDAKTKGLAAVGRPRDLQTNSKDSWVRHFLNRELIQDGSPNSAP